VSEGVGRWPLEESVFVVFLTSKSRVDPSDLAGVDGLEIAKRSLTAADRDRAVELRYDGHVTVHPSTAKLTILDVWRSTLLLK